MFYKKIILSILLFTSCSMNAMNYDVDKNFFLKRWYFTYENFVFENGPDLFGVYIISKGLAISAAIFTLLCKFLMVVDEIPVMGNKEKTEKLLKNSSYIAKRKCFHQLSYLTLAFLTPMILIRFPFMRVKGDFHF